MSHKIEIDVFSVDEPLPENEADELIVFNGIYTVHNDVFYNGVGFYEYVIDGGPHERITDVTHWARLPQSLAPTVAATSKPREAADNTDKNKSKGEQKHNHSR
jgi:hypothetical protein